MVLITLFPPPHLLKFLKEQTRGYRVVTVGSSAGGYSACLYGNWLEAERIYAFNPQFELNSLLKSSTEDINPLLFRYKDNANLSHLYDIEPLVNASPIFYFVSERSDWDASQMKHIGSKRNLTTVIIKSSHHGVPFPRVALGAVLSHKPSNLEQLDLHRFSPWQFSIHFVGVYKTLAGSINQGVKLIKKKITS